MEWSPPRRPYDHARAWTWLAVRVALIGGALALIAWPERHLPVRYVPPLFHTALVGDLEVSGLDGAFPEPDDDVARVLREIAESFSALKRRVYANRIALADSDAAHRVLFPARVAASLPGSRIYSLPARAQSPKERSATILMHELKEWPHEMRRTLDSARHLPHRPRHRPDVRRYYYRDASVHVLVTCIEDLLDG